MTAPQNIPVLQANFQQACAAPTNKKKAKRRNLRQPKANDTQYATLLAMLGDSRLASNLNSTVHHQNQGIFQ